MNPSLEEEESPYEQPKNDYRVDYTFHDKDARYFVNTGINVDGGKHFVEAYYGEDMSQSKKMSMSDMDFERFMHLDEARRNLFLKAKFDAYVSLAAVKQGKNFDLPKDRDLAQHSERKTNVTVVGSRTVNGESKQVSESANKSVQYANSTEKEVGKITKGVDSDVKQGHSRPAVYASTVEGESQDKSEKVDLTAMVSDNYNKAMVQTQSQQQLIHR